MELALEQIISQIVAFLIMYFVLKRYAWKPLFALMDERKRLIASDFETIKNEKNGILKDQEEYKKKLKALDTEAKLKIHDAVEKGNELAEEIAKEARVKAQDILNKAELEMDKEIQLAKNHFKNQVVETSAYLTKKLIGQELDANKHKALIEEAFQKVEK